VSKHYDWDLWGDISENYALDAKGNINTIQTIEKFPAGGQIWKSKEWPALYENPNIKDITINKIDDTGKNN